jgi:hypothetical protein
MTRSITKHPVLVRWGSPNGSLVHFRIAGISLGLRTRSPNDPDPRFAIAYEDADDLDCPAFELAFQRGCPTVGDLCSQPTLSRRSFSTSTIPAMSCTSVEVRASASLGPPHSRALGQETTSRVGLAFRKPICSAACLPL